MHFIDRAHILNWETENGVALLNKLHIIPILVTLFFYLSVIVFQDSNETTVVNR